MTQHKHLKQIVRTRMEKTGERYAAARRNVLLASTAKPKDAGPADGHSVHFSGSVPTATALRTLISAAGVADPRSGKPFTEAMVAGIAGGIGIGVFSFVYEKENFASLFLGAGHLWQDDAAYLRAGLTRFGFEAETRESSATAGAAKALRAILDSGRPAIAFVEAGLLPHRAAPPEHIGGGYHVVTVQRIDDAKGVVFIGDLADQPIALPMAVFATARSRIKKFKNRLIAAGERVSAPELRSMVRDGLAACHRGLAGEGAIANARRNFTLDALADLADRIEGSGRDSWSRQVPPGPRLWSVLTMAYHFVEHAGTGGGLRRGMFAEYLREASSILAEPGLAGLADGYDDVGRRWTAFARAALPKGVPLFDKARDLMAKRAALKSGAIDAKATKSLGAATAGLQDLAREAADCFPLNEEQTGALRADLAKRVRDLHREELRLHELLGQAVAGRIAA